MNEKSYRTYGLPALAVLESILTKGAAPGTSAMAQQKIFEDRDIRAAQEKKDFEEALELARERALNEKLMGYTFEEKEAGKVEREKTKNWRERVKARVTGSTDISEDEKLYAEQFPEDYLKGKFGKMGAGGMGLGGWQLRSQEWDAISKMPEGEEKEAQKLSYLYKWAPSSGYGASPASIDQAGKRALVTGKAGAKGRVSGETEAGGGVNPITFKREDQLRDEYNNLPEIKGLKAIYTNYLKANKAYQRYVQGKASPYEVDQSLGYFASKALDPNSVVMPGEFDRFAKGLGIAEGATALASKLISGGLKLTDEQRKAMLNIVSNGYASALEAGKMQFDNYSDLAKRNGVSVENIIGGTKYLFEPKRDESGWQDLGNGIRVRKKN